MRRPQAPRKKRVKRKRGSKRKKVGNSKLSRYMTMIADPCSAQLTPGIYGDNQGLLGRFQSSYTLTTGGTYTCGYFIWFPGYTGYTRNTTPHNGLNIFNFAHDVSSDAPINTVAVPFGSGLIADTTYGIPDPALPFITAGTCESMRLLGACMKLTYTGKTSDATGQICLLQNVPLDNILPENGTPASVDDLFILSSVSRRLGLDSQEIVFQPKDAALERFRTAEDVCVQQGISGTDASTFGADAKINPPTCFGFAFRGLTPGTLDQYIVEMHKNVEWKPSTGQGMPMTPAVQTSGKSYIQAATNALNKISPTWWDHAANAANFAGNKLVKMALGGVVNYATPPARRALHFGL